MHFSTLLALLLCFLPDIITAHGNIAGAPRIFGRRTVSELRSRRALASSSSQDTHELVKRQRDDTCGPRIGSCAAGLCCSGAGYCGTGIDFCAAPDCLFNYGPACDANATPSGASTSSVARPKLGSVLYGGAGVLDCVVSSTHMLMCCNPISDLNQGPWYDSYHLRRWSVHLYNRNSRPLEAVQSKSHLLYYR